MKSHRASALICCAAALFSCAASAQTTTVTGSIADALGITNTNKLTGTVKIAPAVTFSASNGVVLPAGTAHVVPITAGIITVALLPTQTATPVTAYYQMQAHIPLQTTDGRNCEANSSLISQGICIVGPIDWSAYLLVPSTGPADLKDWYRTKKPAGVTWQDLINNGMTWGKLLNGN